MFKNNKKKINNLGFYIEYALINPELTYESINESSFIIRNIDSYIKSNNIFEWKNVLNNKIKNLLFIYIHMLSIPNKPFLEKKIYTLFSINFISNLIINNEIDINYEFVEIKYQVAFANSDIIDFIINGDYLNYYSYEIKLNKTYIYTQSIKTITNEPFIYLNINFPDNTSLNTSKLTNNFNFKLVPIYLTSEYTYYKSNYQYILKTINTIQTIDKLSVSLSDSTGRLFVNNFINNLCSTTNQICNCENNIKLASCYCVYIRHPLNPKSQIDIGFKIGQIQNELIKNVFH